MKHEDAIKRLEAYSLGALDEEEIQPLQAHLDTGCPECKQELGELESLTNHLALTPPQHSPPPELKASIMAKIKDPSPPVISNPSFSLWWGWAAAALAVMFLIVQGIGVSKIKSQNSALTAKNKTLKQENSDLKQKVSNYEQENSGLSEKILATTSQLATLREQISRIEDFKELLNSPGSQFFNLSGVDPNPQAFGKVIIDPIKGNAVVYVYRLPEPPDCMEYQLWVVRDGKPTSAGVFTVKKDGSTVLKLDEIPDPETIASFSVTIEPNGGQPVPTGMMYLIGP